jgi:hypothetical protein
VAQYENDLASVVHSLILSITEKDLHLVKSDPCNASCLKFSLVKLLRLSGYDAAVCSARWQGSGRVPGGMPFITFAKPYLIESGFLFSLYLSSNSLLCLLPNVGCKVKPESTILFHFIIPQDLFCN